MSIIGPEGYHPHPKRGQEPIFTVTEEGDVVVPDDVLGFVSVPETDYHLHEEVPVEDPNGIPVEDPPEWYDEDSQEPLSLAATEAEESLVEPASDFDINDRATWSDAMKTFLPRLEFAIEKANDSRRNWKHPYLDDSPVDSLFIDERTEGLTDAEKTYLKELLRKRLLARTANSLYNS